MKPTRIYQCPDTTCGILTGIYEAGISRYGHDYIKLTVEDPKIPAPTSLFSEYIEITEDYRKADSAAESIRKNISETAYNYTITALLSSDADKADIAYHFLVYGFQLGPRVISALQLPWVRRMFELNRKVMNEAHFFREFLRFSQSDGVYLSVIEPKSRVVSLIMPHFSDRLNCEPFIIYDKTHAEAGIHPVHGEWFIRKILPDMEQTLENMYNNTDELKALWRTFFDSIAIKERMNPSLQRNMLPIHFRKHMTEFMEEQRGQH